MERDYFHTVPILIFSHMYTTDPFSCNLMCSINEYVSDTKWTNCTLLSNNQSKKMILVYYCSIMVLSNRNHNCFLMWIWFVINIEYLDASWFFLIDLSYHWLTEEFCGSYKQVLLLLCDCNCWSTSALCVCFLSPEIYNLALTYIFLQAAHEKIPSVWMSRHTPNVNLYYQWHFSTINTSPTWEIVLSLKNYRERFTQLECCCIFTVFAIFADSVIYTKLWCRWTLHMPSIIV